uniref:Ig-like domain-containing protein n=1 Tax=Lepisosteus oculatus TaxID=7918 RepID=W5N2Y4_LEPOC
LHLHFTRIIKVYFAITLKIRFFHSLTMYSCSHFRLNRETLQNFAALENISIKRTYIAYIDSDAFHHIPNLRTLILEETNLSNTAIHHNAFHKLRITVLSLRSNRLVRIGHQTFSGLINLQHLDLSGNNIAVIEDSSFTALVNLQFLNLDNNSLNTITSLWFSGASLNNTNLKISLLANNLTCECRYRGIDLPEYAWFKRSLILPNKSCLLYNTKEECKPPKLEEFYQVIHGIALQPLDLHCPVTGFPFPKIMWILPNGLQISNRSFPPFYNIDGTLTIQLVHSSFGGLYACMATNIEGTEIGLYNLVI